MLICVCTRVCVCMYAHEPNTEAMVNMRFDKFIRKRKKNNKRNKIASRFSDHDISVRR